MASRSRELDKLGPVTEEEVSLLIGHLNMNAMPRSAQMVGRLWTELQVYRRDFKMVKKERK
jgi:hypothetical protein